MSALSDRYPYHPTEEIRAVLDSISFRDWRFGLSELDDHADTRYLWVEFEAPDTHTGELTVQSGRDWPIPKPETKSAIAFTAFLAVKTALEHEMLEEFKVEGTAIFYPHQSVDSLIANVDRYV